MDALSSYNSKNTIDGNSFTLQKRYSADELRVIAMSAEIYVYKQIEEAIKAITITKHYADEARRTPQYAIS